MDDMLKNMYFICVLILLCACAKSSEKPESGGLPVNDEGLFLSQGDAGEANEKNSVDIKEGEVYEEDNADAVNDNSFNDNASNANASDTSEEVMESSSAAKRILDKMSLEEKIGQMFMVAYRQDANGNIISLNDGVKESMEKYRPGGVILFSENIKDYEQVKAYIDELQELSDIPLIIGVDEEGGQVSRLKGVIEVLPDAKRIGKKNDPEYTYSLASELAGSLAELGFNMNFSPVCDIDEKLNSIVSNRAFGETPEIVATHSEQIIRGLQDKGIGASAKHFPGHGGTKEDSHFKAAVNYKSLDALREFDLIPFEKAVKAGVAAVMIGHISIPKVAGNNEPAVFQEFLIRDVLRDEMGFKGLVITDAMEMGAIRSIYSSGAAAVKAVKAGVDVILMPMDLDEAYFTLIEAVLSGEIEMRIIDASVERILEYKLEFVFKNSREY